MTMFLPPLVIDVRVRQADEHNFRLWLPVFLLWPLLAILLALALVVALVADLVLLVAGSRYHHSTRLLVGALGLLAAVRGTRAHVRNATTYVRFNIY